MTLDHDAEDPPIAVDDLGGYFASDVDLFLRVLATVTVTEVDHDARGNTGLSQTLGCGVDGDCVVVGLSAAAQNHVTVFVPGGRHDGRMAILCYRKEMMRSLGRTNGIHRDSNVAIGAIFESNRTR